MRIGFLSLPVPGHLNPMTTLARKLQSRGHDVVFISLADVAPFVEAAGYHLCPVRRRHILPARSVCSCGDSVSCQVKMPCTLPSTR
jgi:UDP:flavonoid glycosyltransferase YjiC (YdhE family)